MMRSLMEGNPLSILRTYLQMVSSWHPQTPRRLAQLRSPKLLRQAVTELWVETQ